MEAMRSLTTEESHKEYTRKRRAAARKRNECTTTTISLVKFFNDNKDQVPDGSAYDKILKAAREDKDMFGLVQVCNNFDFDFEKDNFWTYDFEKEPLDEQPLNVSLVTYLRGGSERNLLLIVFCYDTD